MSSQLPNRLSDPNKNNLATDSFFDGFEDGDRESWTVVWFEENQGGSSDILNDWTVARHSELPGNYSLKLHSRSDRNAIATDAFILDLSSDFSFSFEYHADSENSRNPAVDAFPVDESGSESGTRIDPSVGARFVAPRRRPADEEAYLGLFDLSVQLPYAELSPGNTHSVAVERKGDIITAYHDGEAKMQISTDEVNFDFSRTYRLLVRSSGSWGSESTIYFDQFEFTPESGQASTPTTTSTPEDESSDGVLYEEGFESGAFGGEWKEIVGFVDIDNDGYNSGGSIHASNICGFNCHPDPIAKAVPDSLSGGVQARSISHFYKESSSSYGGALSVRNSNGELIAGVATNNPEWHCWSPERERSNPDSHGWGVKLDSGYGYDRWVKTDIELDWQKDEITYTFTDQKNGSSASTTVPLPSDVRHDVAAIYLHTYSYGLGENDSIANGSVSQWWDQLEIRGQDGNVTTNTVEQTASSTLTETKTVAETETVSSTSTPTVTDTPTPTPTGTTSLNYKQGSRSPIQVNNNTYFVISDIPNGGDRLAVTDDNLELVYPGLARGVLQMHTFLDGYYRNDWQTIRENLYEIRSRNYWNHLFGQALDAGWDITEILIYYARGDAFGMIDAAYDLAKDAIQWTMTDVQQPYREMFQKAAASMKSGQNIRNAGQRGNISPYEATDIVQSYGQQAIDLAGVYKTTKDRSRAWKETFDAVTDDGTSFTKAADDIVGQTKGYLIGFAIENSVGAMESAVKTKTKIHAMSNCFANMTIPIVENMINMEQRFESGAAVPGDIAAYHTYAYGTHQSSALAYNTSTKYWRKISENSIWDIIVDADERAKQSQRWASQAKEQAQYAQLSYGLGVGQSELNLERSINVAEYGEPRASLNIPSSIRESAGGGS